VIRVTNFFRKFGANLNKTPRFIAARSPDVIQSIQENELIGGRNDGYRGKPTLPAVKGGSAGGASLDPK
jgi:hypothetical protein